MLFVLYVAAGWIDHSMTLREQGIQETEILLLKRKLFYNVDTGGTDNPIQRNLIYEQVSISEPIYHNYSCKNKMLG